MSNRQWVVEIARSWVGTPFKHHQQLKGVENGCDCVGFLMGVGKELGFRFEVENYHHVPRGERLLRELEKYLVPIEIQEATIGDILVFRGSFKNPDATHVAIKTDIGMIHACSREGRVVEHGLDRERLIINAFRLPTTYYLI